MSAGYFVFVCPVLIVALRWTDLLSVESCQLYKIHSFRILNGNSPEVQNRQGKQTTVTI